MTAPQRVTPEGMLSPEAEAELMAMTREVQRSALAMAEVLTAGHDAGAIRAFLDDPETLRTVRNALFYHGVFPEHAEAVVAALRSRVPS